MEKIWNTIRGLFRMVTEVDQLRADMRDLQNKDHQRDINEQVIIATIRELKQHIEHKDDLNASEARALKAELEAILLRFERRLPPGN